MPPTEEQTYRAGVVSTLERIEEKVTYTNGKVRKIIIALVLLGGILIGQTFTNRQDIIGLFSHLL